MKQKQVTHNELSLLALIAFRDGEISEERCCEITGFTRQNVRDEMRRRTGKFSPYSEAMRELEEM